ncbi:unnamed protein product [Protopolystoma xenopodis]|uniref:Uncharacterized protein n=1 Tax=Protopolystoma xenopodis TaxID=117903 RepID=A0A3S5B0B5_9PLAT|nr:unnamed protein product [Protopolystoma xenopodis]
MRLDDSPSGRPPTQEAASVPTDALGDRPTGQFEVEHLSTTLGRRTWLAGRPLEPASSRAFGLRPTFSLETGHPRPNSANLVCEARPTLT